MVIIYSFDLFFWTMGPHWPKMDPRGSQPWFGAITVTSIFYEKSMTAGWSNIRILGHGNFLRLWSIFWTQWDPIGPKMDPRGSPPWFGAITVTSIFFEFLGMVIFYGFDPFFGPNGTPLAPRWTLGGHHRNLSHNRNFHFFAKNQWPRISRKFKFWVMVIFYGLWPIFFGPNGTPLVPRWTLGCPHRNSAP